MPIITRNRINFPEKQVSLIWQQLRGKELTSTEGGRIEVIYTGRTNGGNGPDFQDAVIVHGSALMKGDVEIHVKSSDWYSHGHHGDAKYNNVALHVVLWHDCDSATLLQSAKAVPVLCLSKALQHQAYMMPYQQLPCFQILNQLDKQTLGNLLNAAGEEKFKQKAMYFQVKLKQQEVGQVLFQGMMRALGYAKNTRPFEELADRVPLNFIESREGLALRQALLLGSAGLLPSQRWHGKFAEEKETQELEQIWQSEGKNVEAMGESDWNLSHIYANNSPVRRIVAQSYLLERYWKGKLTAGIFHLVEEAPLPLGHLVLESGLIVTSDGYWQDHFDFNIRSNTRISALLGHSKAGEIMVNVVLPLAFSWGKIASEPKLMKKAIELYDRYPKLAENELTRHMAKQLCLEAYSDFTACHQQGLIHVFRNYCRQGRCSQCPLVN